jgi:hypothetical protein
MLMRHLRDVGNAFGMHSPQRIDALGASTLFGNYGFATIHDLDCFGVTWYCTRATAVL